MADFSIQTTNLGGPSMAGSSPVAPVERAGKSYNLPIEAVGGFLTSAIKRMGKGDEGVYTRYQQDISSISSAYESGAFSKTEALTRARALNNQYLANNPSGSGEFSKKLSQIYKDVLGMTGLIEAQEAHEDNREAKNQTLKEAREKGLLNPFENPSEQMKMTAAAFSTALSKADDEFQRMTRFQNESRAVASEARANQSEYRAQYAFAQTESAKLALSGVRLEASNYLFRSVEDLRKELEAGGDYATAEAKLAMIANQIIAGGKEVLIGDENSQRILADSINNFQKYALEDLNPATRSTESTARYDDMLYRTRVALMTRDPQLLSLAATSSMLPNLPLTVLDGNSSLIRALDYAKSGGLSGIIMSNDVDNQRTLYQAARATTNQALSGRTSNTTPEQALKEVGDVTNGVIKELEKTADGDGVRLRTTTQYLATPEVAALVERGMLDRQTALSAKEAWQSSYQRNVLMTVTPRLNAPLGASVTRDGSSTQPTLLNVVDFEMRGGQLVVVDRLPKDIYASPQLIRRMSQEIRKEMDEINTLIRAGAHLEGTTDYEAFWEKNKHIIMPDMFPSPKREAEAKSRGYLGGNVLNPSNWSAPNDGPKDE